MTSPLRSWEMQNLQNSSQVLRNSNTGLTMGTRSAPVLPPRPAGSSILSNSPYNSYMPHSGGYGYGSSYSSYGMPYRSSMYNSGYGSYGSYGGMYGGGMYGGGGGMYGANGGYGDNESRFIQYAEESSRSTFASVENIVRAVNSISMMLDNTFFAMTSSFRAVLSVAENFGRLRSMFGHIWYTVNVFRFFGWAYKKMREIMGLKVARSASSAAWKEAASEAVAGAAGSSGGSSWSTLVFLGMLVSTPYIISRFIPKYEDKGDPANWKLPGVRAKAVFDFDATSPNELTIHINDMVNLAPSYIQEEMRLKNTGWALATFNGKSGVVPLNYLVISKTKPIMNNDSNVPVPKDLNAINTPKTHTKRVSFGENQIFENVDLEDCYRNTVKTDSDLSKSDNKVDNKDFNKPQCETV
ncbi:unnamed protein product [Brassicogethes aeneus]|uniref:Peroxisomal membrane protein PEX13 n=1 Tax=Brassicogethes aeneus TaxID=1431903 RepID=A0A9P0AZT4_BRAAE|nr:unnamed protein product [Brassicogethes aeneus]